MATIKVGVREFRENFAMFLESDTPIAVTRHGGDSRNLHPNPSAPPA